MANNNTVKKKKVKMSTGDKVFTVINTVIMILSVSQLYILSTTCFWHLLQTRLL